MRASSKLLAVGFAPVMAVLLVTACSSPLRTAGVGGAGHGGAGEGTSSTSGLVATTTSTTSSTSTSSTSSTTSTSSSGDTGATSSGAVAPPAITHCACIVTTASNAPSCVACIKANEAAGCEADRAACNADPTCYAIIACLFNTMHCTTSPCIEACLGSSPAYDALAQCLCSACATPCNDAAPCPP